MWDRDVVIIRPPLYMRLMFGVIAIAVLVVIIASLVGSSMIFTSVWSQNAFLFVGQFALILNFMISTLICLFCIDRSLFVKVVFSGDGLAYHRLFYKVFAPRGSNLRLKETKFGLISVEVLDMGERFEVQRWLFFVLIPRSGFRYINLASLGGLEGNKALKDELRRNFVY